MHLRTCTQAHTNTTDPTGPQNKDAFRIGYLGLPCPNSCTSSESILPRLSRTSRRTMFPVLYPKAKSQNPESRIQNPNSQQSTSPSASRPRVVRIWWLRVPHYTHPHPTASGILSPTTHPILTIHAIGNSSHNTVDPPNSLGSVSDPWMKKDAVACTCLCLPACLPAHATSTQT
ncbi:hypothetical protein BDR22DRAFT_197441 [Usnea florida]